MKSVIVILMSVVRILAISFFVTAMLSCDAHDSWKPVGERIMTRWSESMDPSDILPEYPRPQLVRDEWKNLNGLWDYAIVEDHVECPGEFEGSILVPFALESSLSGVGKALGLNEALWYRCRFTVPRTWKDRRIMLNFGAIDWKSEIYVDGSPVGEHVGGYDPFSFDITDFLSSKRNHELIVKVQDQTTNWYQPCGKQHNEPNGIWYTPVSGIWQTVWLEPVADVHVDSYVSVADLADSTLAVNVYVSGMLENDRCRIQLLDGDRIISEQDGTNVVFPVVNPRLWSPDDPFLYGLNISIFRDGKKIDMTEGYAAMRQITVVKDSTGHKRMALNGFPLFQYGLLDQGWWPDGLYTAPTDEALMYDIRKTKDFGYNLIRKHVKVEPARWYWHCDRLGMLVWQDMPSVKHGDNVWGNRAYDKGTDSKITPEGKNNYYNEWGEIINDFKMFPCIVMWVPFNEAWGQFDTEEVVAFTRSKDPTRLINYASGGNFVRCSGDVLDLHNYPDPEMFLYDADYINVLGEYGGIGLPVSGHLWKTDKNWGYIEYKNGDDVLNAYEEYAHELMELIDKGFAAAVYTQTTDVEGEVNGLMTYDRKVIKIEEERLAEINKAVINSM